MSTELNVDGDRKNADWVAEQERKAALQRAIEGDAKLMESIRHAKEGDRSELRSRQERTEAIFAIDNYADEDD